MAEVIIRFGDKDESENGNNVDVIFEFNPEIDGDAVGEQLTPAQRTAINVIQAVTDALDRQPD